MIHSSDPPPAHSQPVVEILDDKGVEDKSGDCAEEESGAEDQTDGGESEGENVGGGEDEEAADGDVADHRLEGDEVGLAKRIEDTGEEVAEHEGHVEGEQEK